MVNALTLQHDLQDAAATFMYGQYPIDGLWVTHGITVTRCGYLAPGDNVPGDHSLVWMDVTYDSTLHHSPVLPQTFKARQLWLYNTKTTRRY